MADYKETIVVYGLLDPNEAVHYIKINKAFLGPGNALTMAQNYDSVNFKNKLTVQLQAFDNNGYLVSTIPLKADSSVPKSPGLFSYPKQILYSTKAKLDTTLVYNLTVTEAGNPLPVTGSTGLIGGIQNVMQPSGSFLALSKPDSLPFTVSWQSVNNAKVYGVTLRFYYVEQDKVSGHSVNKQLDWVLPTQVATYTQAGNTMQISVPGKSFYQFLATQLSPDPTKRRFIRQKVNNRNFDLIFTTGSQDLYTYIQISQPSTAITQNPPQFSDLKNGIGLFTARNMQIYSPSFGYYMAGATVDSLYAGQFTRSLFCDSIPTSPYYCN